MAPIYGTYGFDVIASIGWQRQQQYQTYGEIHGELADRVQISPSQVRYLYTDHYLPLLACHEQARWAEVKRVSAKLGLILTLDGLAPEGGGPQLWLVRELRTAQTLRSGWLSEQGQTTFENFLGPIAEQGLQVAAVLSDKQRGLVPAVAVVFPQAQHAFCQSHYLANIAEPAAQADEGMKVNLRQSVREAIGDLIRPEQVEGAGVLTITGLLPSPINPEQAAESSARLEREPGPPACVEQEQPSPPLPSLPGRSPKRRTTTCPVSFILTTCLTCRAPIMTGKVSFAVSISNCCGPPAKKEPPGGSSNAQGLMLMYFFQYQNLGRLNIRKDLRNFIY